MAFFIQQVINGLFLGALYALIALGFNFIWGLMGVLNVAHIAMFPLTIFLTAYLLDQGVPPLAAFPLGICGAIIVSLLIERLILRPLRSPGRDVEHLGPVMATLGLSIMIENTLAYWKGARNLRFPERIPNEFWDLNGVLVSRNQFFMFIIAMVLMGALFYWVRVAKLGKAMRAAAENAVVAGTMGIDVNRLIFITMVIATGLTGVAALMYVMLYGTYNAYLGFGVALNGFVAMIVGGLGHFHGSVIAGLLLGVAQALAIGYISSSLAPAIAYGILIVVLLIRPQGIFGTAIKAR